jgi:aminopeptidase N
VDRAARRDSLNEQMLHEYRLVPPNNEWWHIKTGRPERTRDLFRTVYFRGAMTVQALRNVVGARDFRRIVRTWVREYDHATTWAFVDLAERISGRSLGRLFRVWLFTPERPERTVANGFPPVRSP